LGSSFSAKAGYKDVTVEGAHVRNVKKLKGRRRAVEQRGKKEKKKVDPRRQGQKSVGTWKSHRLGGEFVDREAKSQQEEEE